jgi:hypothetical protein
MARQRSDDDDKNAKPKSDGDRIAALETRLDAIDAVLSTTIGGEYLEAHGLSDQAAKVATGEMPEARPEVANPMEAERGDYDVEAEAEEVEDRELTQKTGANR